MIFFAAVVYAINVTADGLKVSSFSVNPQDLSARTESRLNYRGNNCALVKVQCPVNRLSFNGNVIGDVKYENSVYWVYMDNNSDFLLVNMNQGDPLYVNFSEYLQNDTLESNTTYDLQIAITKYDFHKHYSPMSNGEENGHKYVDLGLSVYWATCNIGANIPNEDGDLFAWGEISPRKNFSLENYIYYTGHKNSLADEAYTNYWLNNCNGVTLKKIDDAASVNWGGSWRIPNNEELIELFTNCTFYWTTYNGNSGLVVTGPNGNSIFLPYAKTEQEIEVYENTYGHFVNYTYEKINELPIVRKTYVSHYSSSYSNSFPTCGPSIITLYFTDQMAPEYKNLTDMWDWAIGLNIQVGTRYDGYSIRPVLPKK